MQALVPPPKALEETLHSLNCMQLPTKDMWEALVWQSVSQRITGMAGGIAKRICIRGNQLSQGTRPNLIISGLLGMEADT